MLKLSVERVTTAAALNPKIVRKDVDLHQN